MNRYINEINDIFSFIDNTCPDIWYDRGIHYGEDLDDYDSGLLSDCAGLIEISYGVTKSVFVYDDHVIKIPNCLNNEICEEMKDDFHLPLHTLNDYCYLEYVIYKEAVAEGLGFLFAETKKLNDINGTCFYYQEKAMSFADVYSSSSSKYTKEERDNTRQKIGYYQFNDEWMTEVYIRYGEVICHNLIAFLENHNINDFHGGNYGYSDDIEHRPILIDFSGYYSNSSYEDSYYSSERSYSYD